MKRISILIMSLLFTNVSYSGDSGHGGDPDAYEFVLIGKQISNYLNKSKELRKQYNGKAFEDFVLGLQESLDNDELPTLIEMQNQFPKDLNGNEKPCVIFPQENYKIICHRITWQNFDSQQKVTQVAMEVFKKNRVNNRYSTAYLNIGNAFEQIIVESKNKNDFLDSLDGVNYNAIGPYPLSPDFHVQKSWGSKIMLTRFCKGCSSLPVNIELECNDSLTCVWEEIIDNSKGDGVKIKVSNKNTPGCEQDVMYFGKDHYYMEIQFLPNKDFVVNAKTQLTMEKEPSKYVPRHCNPYTYNFPLFLEDKYVVRKQF